VEVEKVRTFAMRLSADVSALWCSAEFAAYVVLGIGALLALHLELLLLGARASGIDRPTRRADWIRWGAILTLGLVFLFPPLKIHLEGDCHCLDEEVAVAPIPLPFALYGLKVPGNDLMSEALAWRWFLPEVATVVLAAAALTLALGRGYPRSILASSQSGSALCPP
jgi:hypothetical protein